MLARGGGGGAPAARLFIVKYGFSVGCGCGLRGTLRVNERVKISQIGRQRRRGNTMAVLHCIHAALMASHTHAHTPRLWVDAVERPRPEGEPWQLRLLPPSPAFISQPPLILDV